MAGQRAGEGDFTKIVDAAVNPEPSVAAGDVRRAFA